MPAYTKRIDIPGKSAQELYEKITAEIDHLMAKISVGDFKIDRDPQNKQLHLKASMVTATLSCKDACLELDAKLSLFAAPFRSKIDGAIEKWVAKTFQINGNGPSSG